jgi:ribonuclease E
MTKRMLIDASHAEETRVVVVSGNNRVEEFDFESASRKPLKGNIYLARVTRVEPSLQAAFIEYGGNRHGFLAFSEIHPDYYQIPYADRQALLAAAREEERRGPSEDEGRGQRRRKQGPASQAAADAPQPDAAAEFVPEAEIEMADPLPSFDIGGADEPVMPAETVFDIEPAQEAAPDPAAETSAAAETFEADAAPAPIDEPIGETGGIEEIVTETVEAEVVSSGEDDDGLDEEEPRRAPRFSRNYKIQDVIKKRQVLLIQVVKEERGNKGAALTTYLSLAGRYCVLMPNSGRGGGISRKITNPADRRRLKEAAETLEVPDGMGLIVRTAGASRTKQEIQRDYEYLLRLWDSIRELALRSMAPALIYEEGNIIKRAIRDRFSKDIDDIVVQGTDGYAEARAFMNMLMPAQTGSVKHHDGRPPLFQKFRVESQLDQMFNPRVQLKSGGYIIINQTEALVAIDVNSGRSTREHNIEDTALKTNLEAAEEVARQLRLRDLAGLIVIDFIDMEENRNNRAVERRIKDCLRADRARIQIGRISAFGLLEMSRQRLRQGVVEGSTVSCPHCNGTGLIRSVESLALRALRMVEEEAAGRDSDGVTVKVPSEVALYLLNNKRAEIFAIEERLGSAIYVEGRNAMLGADVEVERSVPAGYRPARPAVQSAVSAETALAMLDPYDPSIEVEEDAGEPPMSDIEEVEEAGGTDRPERGDRGNGRNKRRRGRDRGRDRDRPRGDRPPALPAAPAANGSDPLPVLATGEPGEAEDTSDEDGGLAHEAGTASGAPGDGSRRRRGRRGGRRNRRDGRDGFAPLPPVDDAVPGGVSLDAIDDGLPDTTPDAAIRAPRDAEAAVSEPDMTPAPQPKAKPSATAAIARFFGWGARKDEDAAPAPQPEPAPAPLPAAAAPPQEPEPAPAAPRNETPAELPVARAEPPKPEAIVPAAPEPEPAPVAEVEPVKVEATPQPEPAKPEPVVEPWPESSGEGRKGWWKKRGE